MMSTSSWIHFHRNRNLLSSSVINKKQIKIRDEWQLRIIMSPFVSRLLSEEKNKNWISLYKRAKCDMSDKQSASSLRLLFIASFSLNAILVCCHLRTIDFRDLNIDCDNDRGLRASTKVRDYYGKIRCVKRDKSIAFCRILSSLSIPKFKISILVISNKFTTFPRQVRE